MTEIHSKGFLKDLQLLLHNECGDNFTLTREEVCTKLGLDPDIYISTISAIIKSGQIPGFEMKRGAAGGIGKTGVKTVQREDRKPIRKTLPKEESLTPEFIRDAGIVLNQMITLERPFVKRHEVIAEMARRWGYDTGSSAENDLSLAIHSNKISGFFLKQGINGGIGKIPVAKSSGVQKTEKALVSVELTGGIGPFKRQKKVA